MPTAELITDPEVGETATRVTQAVLAGDPADVEDLLADGLVWHVDGPPAEEHAGPRTVHRYAEHLARDAPAADIELWASGRVRGRRRREGYAMVLLRSRRGREVAAAHIYRLEGRRVAEAWSVHLPVPSLPCARRSSEDRPQISSHS